MNLCSSALAAAIASHHGIVTNRDLIADGCTTNVIRRSVTEGLLVRVHDGVYRVATSPDTFESRCVAVCAADPTAVITGTAAGRLWQFRHVYRTEPTVLVAH